VADRVNPDKFYAYDGAGGQLWASTDGGKTFNKAVGSLPGVSNMEDGNVTAAPGIEGELWICCGGGGLYRSFNSGQSAAQVGNVAQAFRMGFGRASTPGGHPAIYLYGTIDGILGFFRSDDTGSTWTRINEDRRQYGWIHQITGDPRVYGRCYVSAEGRGILYGEPQDTSSRSDILTTFKYYAASADSLRHPDQTLNVTWSTAKDPRGSALSYVAHYFGPGVDTTFTTSDTTASFPAGNIQASSSYILTGQVTNGIDTTASTNSLAFLTASLLSSAQEKPAEVPGTFALYQNYPNPFNPRTTITYSIPLAGFVTLRIYDIIGREIATLVRNQRQSAGSHEVTFQGDNLSSGAYFYRLQAAGRIQTREMVLLK
jgi:hypothetical protein